MGIHTPKKLKESLENVQDEIWEFISAVKLQICWIIPKNIQKLSREDTLDLLTDENCSPKIYDFFIQKTGKNMRSILFAHPNFWTYFFQTQGPIFESYDFSHSVIPLSIHNWEIPKFQNCNLENTIFLNKLEETYHKLLLPWCKINKFTRLMRGEDDVDFWEKNRITMNENIVLHEKFSQEYDDFEALHFEQNFTEKKIISRQFSFGYQEWTLYCFKKDGKYFFALNQNVFVNQWVLKKWYVYEATWFNDEILKNNTIVFYDMIPDFWTLEIRPVRMLDVRNESIKEYF